MVRDYYNFSHFRRQPIASMAENRRSLATWMLIYLTNLTLFEKT